MKEKKNDDDEIYGGDDEPISLFSVPIKISTIELKTNSNNNNTTIQRFSSHDESFIFSSENRKEENYKTIFSSSNFSSPSLSFQKWGR